MAPVPSLMERRSKEPHLCGPTARSVVDMPKAVVCRVREDASVDLRSSSLLILNMLRWLVLTLLYRSAASQLVFSAGFSDDAVLQRSANSGAVVYGFATTNDPVTLTLTGGDPQKVAATVTPWVHSACGAVNDTKTPCPAPPHGPFVANLRQASIRKNYTSQAAPALPRTSGAAGREIQTRQ